MAEKPRPTWGRRIEFFLTSVGYSVGVGDLWRFPYLVMKNGGGAFLIPIVIFNIVGAMPIVYLEMLMGQYSQSGAVSVWRVCPMFKGVGYGTCIATFLFAIYYAVIIGWMLYYFIHSFFPTLPWSTCDNDWNTDACIVERTVLYNTTTTTATMATTVASNVTTTLATTVTTLNATSTTAAAAVEYATSAEEFWKYNTLRISEGLHDLGAVHWPLLGCLAAIEVFCFLCIFKGVKVTGKVVYFTVLAPFVLLTVFLIRVAILPGAERGVLFYLTPDLEKLKEPKIWAEACMQVFISIGPGFGGMITFASFNKFTNNCMRDAVLVCLLDLFTGLFGGFVIFIVLGHVSWKTDIPIENFNQSGFGLGFIAYPEAANYLPISQLWCALFFFMTIFLGIDSQFPNYEIVVTALRDEFPKVLGRKKYIMTLVVILAAFLLAIPQVTEGGIYVLTLVDWYAATFSVTIFALLECVVMVYIYGMGNIEKNMREMTGRGIPIIFKISWYFVTPILLAVTIGFAIFTYAPAAYGGYEYPDWAISMGWLIACCSLVPIPLMWIYRMIVTEGTFLERLRFNCKPSPEWGPRTRNGAEGVEFDDVTKVSADQERNKELENKNGLQNPTFVGDRQTDKPPDWYYTDHL